MQGIKNMLRLDPEEWIATDRWWHAWNRHMFLFCFVQGKTQLGLSRMKLTPCCCSEDGITWEPCPEICKGSSVWLGNVTVMVWQWLIPSFYETNACQEVGRHVWSHLWRRKRAVGGRSARQDTRPSEILRLTLLSESLLDIYQFVVPLSESNQLMLVRETMLMIF